MLFDYPKSAAYGRVLPKKKIYDNANPSAAVKDLFVRQVEKIVWQYKLAPETINLPKTPSVPEVQIFAIHLKNGELKKDILRSIDRVVLFPTLFELHYEGQIKAIAAYKRPSEADSSKWVVSDYFETPWLPDEIKRTPLPLVLDLEVLYMHLLSPLLPFPARQGEALRARVERMEQIRFKEQEITKCESLLHKEKQFNRKVAINAELRELKQEQEGLIA